MSAQQIIISVLDLMCTIPVYEMVTANLILVFVCFVLFFLSVMPCENFHIDIKPPDSVRLRNGMGTYIDNIIQSTRKVLHLWHSRIALRHLV